jgi:hypothetical protein
MEMIRSPKRRFKLEVHGINSQEISKIDTAVRFIKSDCTVTQMWNTVTLRGPDDGDDTFSETSVRTRATRYKVPEGIYK